MGRRRELVDIIETKAVGYAYTSSPISRHFGLSRTGCWYVEAITREFFTGGHLERHAIPLAACPDQLAAIAYAEAMPEPWDRYSMHEVRP